MNEQITISQNSFDHSPLSAFLRRMIEILHEYCVPLIAAVLVGLCAHGFSLTNKLVNFDDVNALFRKGATLVSGRWGLELISWLFPDYSMPWIYGLISILMVAAAVCLLISVFQIQSKLLQVLLAGLVVTFPSLIGTFCYTFTLSSYALAFLMSILAVWLVVRGKLWQRIVGVLLSVFSLGIYQAYISVTAGLFVVYLICQLLQGSELKKVWRSGLLMLLHLAVALGLYYLILRISIHITGTVLGGYAEEKLSGNTGLLRSLKHCYTFLYEELRYGSYGVIATTTSRAVHVILALLGAGSYLIWILHTKEWRRILFSLALVAALPAAVDSILMIATGSAHALMFFSFIAFYVLSFVLFEKAVSLCRQHTMQNVLKLVAPLSCVVLIMNCVYLANSVYLRMHLAYENSYSFYTSLIAQIKEMPEFEEGCKLAVIGETDRYRYDYSEFHEWSYIVGTHGFDVNDYSRESFIRYFCGFDIPFIEEEEIPALISTQEFQNMAEYPYYSSVQRIGDFIVVKLGNVDYGTMPSSGLGELQSQSSTP